MKKDFIFAPIMLLIGAALFLLRFTGMQAHIAISVVGILVLAVYTATTKKEWKIPALEIIMRACYGIALISGVIIMKLHGVLALAIVHKLGAALFVISLAVILVFKLAANKNVD